MGRALAELIGKAGAAATLLGRDSVPAFQTSSRSNNEIWITCKRPHLHAALIQWKPLLDALPNVRLFFLQNGLGLARDISEVLGTRPWTRVACWWGSRQEGVALHLTPRPRRMSFAGTHDPDFWRLAGFEVESLSEEASASLEWRKALTNLTLNALLAFEREPNGTLLARPDLMERARALHLEARRVAGAIGVVLPSEQRTWEEVLATARSTPTNRNSLLQDLEAGRPTELAWLNTWLRAEGRARGLPTPANDALLDQMGANSSYDPS